MCKPSARAFNYGVQTFIHMKKIESSEHKRLLKFENKVYRQKTPVVQTGKTK